MSNMLQMERTELKDRESLVEAVRHGNVIRLHGFFTMPNLTRKLELALRTVLKHYRRAELGDCLYACVVEMVTNASRANMKHAHFLDASLDPDDPEQYARGTRDFRRQRHEDAWLKTYRRRVRELGLTIDVVFHHGDEGLRIEVINNLPLLSPDERRIREKFAHAMRSGDIYEFFQDHGDDTEGQGLGFAMNVLFLRSENIDPGLFRIGSSNGRTVARLEIPFSPSYRSVRAKEFTEIS